MQVCTNTKEMEECNDDDDNRHGDDVKGNYISECEPLADLEHSERIEKPILYAEMQEHGALPIRAIQPKKEYTSTIVFNNDNDDNDDDDDNAKRNFVENRPHYNIPYVSLVEHKWRNPEIKWKLPLYEHEHQQKQLQSLLMHKGKRIGPIIATERHLASFSLRELSHRKSSTEPMEITKWSKVALEEERHITSTEPTNMYIPKKKKEHKVTGKKGQHKEINKTQQEQHVEPTTRQFAHMTVMSHKVNNSRDANYYNENNLYKVTVSRIGNYNGNKNIHTEGNRDGNNNNNSNRKEAKLLSASSTTLRKKEEEEECSTSGNVNVHDEEKAQEVMLHIYDLSKGVMARYSKLALGEFSPAIYHSGVVCYGKEFIFEGGIAMWRAGQTRFGNKFAVVNAGHTTKSLKEFLEWIEERELSVYQLSDYDVAQHNCHHFTRSAVHFLTNNRSTVPSYLFHTVETIRRSIIGAAMLEVVSLLTCSFQYIAAKQQHSRLIERLIACDVLTNASVVCEVNTLPPCMCVLFRLGECASVQIAFDAMEPFVEHLIKRKKISTNAKIMYKCFVRRLLESSADRTLASTDMESLEQQEKEEKESLRLPTGTTPSVLLFNFVDMIVKVLMENVESVWGPVLNVLRIALLDLNVCVECTSHKWLIPLLLHAASHFTRLVPVVKLALLRVLCNLASFGHGAIVLRDEHYVSVWISAIGMALCDSSPAIVYSAACLSLNITMALITISVQSLRNEVKHHNSVHRLAVASASTNTTLNNNNTTITNSASFKESTHPIYRLITIILYHFRKSNANRMHEVSRNMLLHSLMRLMSANGNLLNFTVHHTLQIKCDELIGISSTNDSRALLCIIKALHVLHRK